MKKSALVLWKYVQNVIQYVCNRLHRNIYLIFKERGLYGTFKKTKGSRIWFI